MSRQNEQAKSAVDKIIDELVPLLSLPWEENWDQVEALFKKVAERKGVKTLVKRVLHNHTEEAIHFLSGVLSHVLWYPKEREVLYWWIDHLPVPLDADVTDSFIVGIQQHIIVGIEKPVKSEIWRIMLPILLKGLEADDWTTWNSTITSLHHLDNGCRLGRWLTQQELTALKEVLRRQIKRATEEWDCGDIGRLKRFLA